MPKPRFTDRAKWKVPYTPSNLTDIRETFRRVREEQQKNALEAKDKVLRMKAK